MRLSRSGEARFLTRLTAGLALVAASCAVFLVALTSDKGSTLADSPWDCNRDGTVCNPF